MMEEDSLAWPEVVTGPVSGLGESTSALGGKCDCSDQPNKQAPRAIAASGFLSCLPSVGGLVPSV